MISLACLSRSGTKQTQRNVYTLKCVKYIKPLMLTHKNKNEACSPAIQSHSSETIYEASSFLTWCDYLEGFMKICQFLIIELQGLQMKFPFRLTGMMHEMVTFVLIIISNHTNIKCDLVNYLILDNTFVVNGFNSIFINYLAD